MFPASTKGGGQCLAFPDVCSVPAPPAPFAPIPYPNAQLEANLKKANEADARAKSGSKAAKKQQAEAIDNLRRHTGLRVASATQAVLIGRTVHLKSGNSSSSAGQQIAPSQTKVLISG